MSIANTRVKLYIYMFLFILKPLRCFVEFTREQTDNLNYRLVTWFY